jgi:hypothetical protein
MRGTAHGIMRTRLDAETKQRVHDAARAAGVSRSRWLADLVRRNAPEGWPAVGRKLAGAWPGFPEATEIRRGWAHDLRREQLWTMYALDANSVSYFLDEAWVGS